MVTAVDKQMQLFRDGDDVVARLAWDRDEVASDTRWRLAVGDELIAELRAYFATVEVTRSFIDEVTLDDGELPLLRQLADQVRRQLLAERGFAVVAGVERAGLTELELRLFYVLLSLCLGEILPAYGRQHDVMDRGLDFRKSDVSVSKTRVEAPFHTDSTSLSIYPNAFGLLCVRPAMSGGQSMLVSALKVYQGLADRHPEHLRTLFQDHIRNTVTPGDEDVDVHDNKFPIFSWGRFAEGPTFRYMRHWVETGYQKAGLELDAASVAAFDALDAELHRPENIFTLDLQAGEVLLLNNGTVAHNRSEFVDFPEDSKKRLLVRTWLSVPEKI